MLIHIRDGIISFSQSFQDVFRSTYSVSVFKVSVLVDKLENVFHSECNHFWNFGNILTMPKIKNEVNLTSLYFYNIVILLFVIQKREDFMKKTLASLGAKFLSLLEEFATACVINALCILGLLLLFLVGVLYTIFFRIPYFLITRGKEKGASLWRKIHPKKVTKTS